VERRGQDYRESGRRRSPERDVRDRGRDVYSRR
jgi:hypothetical protein